MANHKELCFGLRHMGSPRAERAADLIESQAARIQQQALEYLSLLAQCEEHLAMIAELEADRDSWRDQASQRVADWDEMRKERDALHENARQFYNLTQGDVTVIIRAPSAEKRNAIITASNRLRAALQAEKETK